MFYRVDCNRNGQFVRKLGWLKLLSLATYPTVWVERIAPSDDTVVDVGPVGSRSEVYKTLFVYMYVLRTIPTVNNVIDPFGSGPWCMHNERPGQPSRLCRAKQNLHSCSVLFSPLSYLFWLPVFVTDISHSQETTCSSDSLPGLFSFLSLLRMRLGTVEMPEFSRDDLHIRT